MTAWITLLALAFAEEPVEKAKASVSLTDDFEIRYYLIDDRLPDPDDVPVFNYVEQVNRLNGAVNIGDWTIEAQVDEVALFANQYRLDVFPALLDTLIRIDRCAREEG